VHVVTSENYFKLYCYKHKLKVTTYKIVLRLPLFVSLFSVCFVVHDPGHPLPSVTLFLDTAKHSWYASTLENDHHVERNKTLPPKAKSTCAVDSLGQTVVVTETNIDDGYLVGALRFVTIYNPQCTLVRFDTNLHQSMTSELLLLLLLIS